MAIVMIAGLMFGDEGKGALVDYIVSENGSELVVRYNGGPQAAHNVVLPDGTHHTFRMFGSGSFSGAKTYLSQYVAVDPYVIWQEGQQLHRKGVDDPYSKLFIHEDCVIVTPFHQARSQWAAIRHQRGTCGTGTGTAFTFAKQLPEIAVTAKDLLNPDRLRHCLIFIKDHFAYTYEESDVIDNPEKELEEMIEFYRQFAETISIVNNDDWRHMVNTYKHIVFEGAQGVLIGKETGFKPYVTSSDSTFNNAEELLMYTEHNHNIEKVGCIRSYLTRHGPGPFTPSEGLPDQFVEDKHNTENEFQGKMRNGWLDAFYLRTVCDMVDFDVFSVSHLDFYNSEWYVPFSPIKSSESNHPIDLTHNLWAGTGKPVKYVSYGEKRSDRRTYEQDTVF